MAAIVAVAVAVAVGLRWLWPLRCDATVAVAMAVAAVWHARDTTHHIEAPIQTNDATTPMHATKTTSVPQQ